ncbi:MAG: hypothetical protein ABIU20_08115 [Blastocatellia bacterium]
MKSVTSILAVILLFAIAVTASADQKFQRIRFERGRTSAVVKGTVTDSEQENLHEYKLRVGKGQTIYVHLTSPVKAANFRITFPDGSMASEGDLKKPLKDWEGPIPTSGDIVIEIYHQGKARSMPYTLEVTVR